MRSPWALVLAGALPALVAVWPGQALANGRFPGAYQLVIRQRQAALSTSFGVVTTGDGFGTTRWICEDALGYSPADNNDLGLAIFGDGAMVVSGPAGLTLTHDLGCDNVKVVGAPSALWMADVSVDRDQDGGTKGIAVSRQPQGAGECAGEPFESSDNGKSWAALGPKLPAGFCAFTLDSAPSRSDRIYISGNTVGPDGSKLVAQLLVSDDRGKTWTTREIPSEARPFIAAMDPTNPDIVYVRTSNPPAKGNLLVTTDAGKTFQTIATLSGVALNFYGVTGVAVSPDGKHVAYGSINEGLFVLEKGKSEPEKRAAFPVMCLRWEADGLYACSGPNLCGPFLLGRSGDEGRTFEAVLPLLDINGDSTDCPAGTRTADRCPAQWAAVRQRVGVCEADAGTIPGGDAGADAGADGGPEPPSFPGSNCDCHLGAAGDGPPFMLAGALVGLAWFARRRGKARR